MNKGSRDPGSFAIPAVSILASKRYGLALPVRKHFHHLNGNRVHFGVKNVVTIVDFSYFYSMCVNYSKTAFTIINLLFCFFQ